MKKHLSKEYLNQLRTAKRKLYSFCKKNNIQTKDVKLHNLIYLYSVFIGKPIEAPSRKGNSKWLHELYLSNSDLVIIRSGDDPEFEAGWPLLRNNVLKTYGRICMRCGSKDNIHVDHIKPRSLYPELKLDFDNMQVLCGSCNCSKGNRRIVDYRKIHPLQVTQ
jgi:hypothetical protein